jgi:hypothetical protein
MRHDGQLFGVGMMAHLDVSNPPKQSQSVWLLHQVGEMEEWHRRLSYYVHESVGELRINQLFDIVVEYPDR